MQQLGNAFGMMFTLQPTNWVDAVAKNTAILKGLFYLPLGIVCSFPIIKKVQLGKTFVGTMVSHAVHFALLILCIITIISTKYNPFIYFRF